MQACSFDGVERLNALDRHGVANALPTLMLAG